MKTLKILCLPILLAFIISGCSTTGKFTNLSLGMTKSEVIQAIGKPNTVRGAKINDRGQQIEVFEYCEYKTPTDNYYRMSTSYVLYFTDGKLTKWGEPQDWHEADQTIKVKMEKE